MRLVVACLLAAAFMTGTAHTNRPGALRRVRLVEHATLAAAVAD